MLGQQISVGVLPRLQGAKRHGIMGNSQSRSINHLWKIIYRWIIIYKSMHQLGGFDGKIIYKSRFLAEIPKWRFFFAGKSASYSKKRPGDITSGSTGNKFNSGVLDGSNHGYPKIQRGSTPQRNPDRINDHHLFTYWCLVGNGVMGLSIVNWIVFMGIQ